MNPVCQCDASVMAKSVRITIPVDLAEELAKDGFYEVKRVRGLDGQATLIVVETTISLTANLATILVWRRTRSVLSSEVCAAG